MTGRCLWAMLAALVVLAAQPPLAHAVRIKDLVSVKGVRSNHLTGYGVVVGLDGTGDGNSALTSQAMSNLLKTKSIRLPPNALKPRNVASVIVTAELPPFINAGDRIDVSVSSIEGAKSLQGGVLLWTALEAGDAQVYAVAQGALTGGVGATSKDTSTKKGALNTARIVNGAIVERELPSSFDERTRVNLSLKDADFTTASRTATAINLALGLEAARALNARTVAVDVPPSYQGRTADFIATIERIDVSPDRSARVVININTGTVVIGEDVQVSTVAISHGALSIEIQQDINTQQPYPFSLGTTRTDRNTQVEITEEGGKLTVLPGGVSIGDLARALNAMGVSPRDLASIFQALKSAGALNAEIIIQ